MRGGMALFAAALFCGLLAACRTGAGKGGESLFVTHCAGCHPNGGNTIRAGKTLGRSDREANGIRTAEDVAAYIRKPGQGMPVFSEGMIPPGDALRIGEYVVGTFK
ncbi:MAG: cytochrome C [Desulfuromonadales bacterium]|nr:MAG: cytochrome C [Desulfuromonadales bacterium]